MRLMLMDIYMASLVTELVWRWFKHDDDVSSPHDEDLPYLSHTFGFISLYSSMAMTNFMTLSFFFLGLPFGCWFFIAYGLRLGAPRSS
ncbi:unnamed protein product [Cochlearia groenlandica]